ncbi:hypothetical protein AX17_003044 [Amanita inopinata Kibby_2008]|nr:hypothetical protein AX17_003044 [Amanita inopinata Kibby_2008]
MTGPSMFTSGCLPQYAPLVEELRISGFLSPRPPPLNSLPTTLSNAVQNFHKLRAITLTPALYHEDVFTQTLHALKNISTLTDLTVNSSCIDAPRAPLIVQIHGLDRLEMRDPTRAILDALPEWLDRLSGTLKGLHLKDNCGSITPGVLHALALPRLQDNLCALSLGLSYSLTHDDVFRFLNNFPQLEELELRYYWQLKSPSVRLCLGRLRRFTAVHVRTEARGEVMAFCKWMRAVVSSSAIEDLRIICDGDDALAESGANVGFDSVIDHLSKKHYNSLRFLDLRSAYVGLSALKTLLSTCRLLQHFHVAARKDALDIFAQLSPGLKHLHTAGFRTCNIKQNKFHMDHDSVKSLMQGGPSTFRKLIVNGTTWEGSWSLDKDGNTVFSVQEYPSIRAPWEREQ